jgi:hypothetical protein
MPKTHHPIGLDHRTRDRDGVIRHKRSDTLVATLRKEYGPTFAQGHRGDMKLGTLLEKTDHETLSDYLKKP